jgi:hypothetical protein
MSDQHGALGMTEPAIRKERPGVSWQGIASLTAIASLVVALIFNGLQVQQTRHASDEDREATELQVFTQLHQLVNDSLASVVISGDSWNTGVLSEDESRSLSRAMNDMEYLAWLFNRGYVKLSGAEALWAPAVRCVYDTASSFWTPKEITTTLPALNVFVQGWKCNI